MEAHEEGNNSVHCLVYKPSVSWATISNKDENGKRFLNIANNKDNNDRETTVRYYIQEDPSVFLDYKIRQIEGVYTFVFNKRMTTSLFWTLRRKGQKFVQATQSTLSTFHWTTLAAIVIPLKTMLAS